MDRRDDCVRFNRQKTVDKVRAGSRFGFGAPVAVVLGPNTGEREQRTILIEREPNDILLSGFGVRLRREFSKTGRRDQTAVFRLQPTPPVRGRRAG